MPRVKIDMAGTIFQIDRRLIDSLPGTKLHELCLESEATGRSLEFVFDRPIDCFAAILGFYQTGKFHMPNSVCPAAFEEELNFWKMDSSSLASCCLTRYENFFDEEDTLNDFDRHELQASCTGEDTDIDGSTWSRRKQKLWSILENKGSSFATKFYFVILLLMIATSIFSTALRTEAVFQRKLTKCELLDHIAESPDYTQDDYQRMEERLKENACDDTPSPDGESGGRLYFKVHGKTTFPPGVFTAPDTANLSFINDSGNVLNDTGALQIISPVFFKMVPVKVWFYVFNILDYAVTIFFFIELVFRLWCCPSFKKYFMSIINLIDIAAIVCACAHVTIQHVLPDERYRSSEYDLLIFVQVLRAFRVVRVLRTVTAFKVLSYSLSRNKQDLVVILMFLLVGILTFSSLLFFLETRDTFPTIPTAWWWAVITMTTVGYGDFVPETTSGRVLGAVCSVAGLILLSSTVPIFVNNFLVLYQYALVRVKIHSRNKLNSKAIKSDLTGKELVSQTTNSNIIVE